ncbi:hypothetical protein [Ktedonospora formicarum]|uniref:hypothetical protein n=1 Tax=Ktedonospora formicarum TaxID=2778364 RepID=UPI001C692D52
MFFERHPSFCQRPPTVALRFLPPTGFPPSLAPGEKLLARLTRSIAHHIIASPPDFFVRV